MPNIHSQPEPLIRVRNLWKSFGTHAVLRGLDLDIPKGQVTVIIGQSGEGKSVLLKQLMGLLKPDTGEIWIDQTEVSAFNDFEWNQLRQRFGVLFQNGALFDSMTVFDNILFPLIESQNGVRIRRDLQDSLDQVVRQKLELVGLKNIEHNMPDELSGGMRKRVALARAIVLNPEIMFYDEPTTGLDPVMTDAIYDLINDMQAKLKTTSIVISHDMEGALKIANQIVVLEHGKIVEQGTPDDLIKSTYPLVQRFFHRDSRKTLSKNALNFTPEMLKDDA